MSGIPFRLLEFPTPGFSPALQIAGQIARVHPGLELAYVLRGEVQDLLVPDPVAPALRRDGLWEHTCFELFVAPHDCADYWEFNFSPSGEWNVYRFDGYRTHRQAEAAFAALPFRVTRGDGCLSLALTLRPPSQRWAGALDIGVNAVTEHAGERRAYWGLAHVGPVPDFHRREGFLIRA